MTTSGGRACGGKQFGIMRPDEVRRPVAIVPNESAADSLHICWMLHDLCNYRCSYCDEANWGGNLRGFKFDDAVIFLVRLFNRYRKPRYHVSFTGGEPTLWPDFPRLCRFLHDHGCNIGLTTNASRPATYWQPLGELLTWVCLSYHAEFAKDSEFLRVIEALAPRTRVAVRLMMHRDREMWMRSVAFGEKIKALSPEIPLFVEYVPLDDDFAGKKKPLVYDDWQLEFFRQNNHFTQGSPPPEVAERLSKHRDVWDFDVIYSDGTREACRPNKLVAGDQANFRGWTCKVENELLFIDAAGDVFSSCCKIGGKLGTVEKGFTREPQAEYVCDRDYCSCGTDILVSKWAP
jgi:organic radical activating enzyme